MKNHDSICHPLLTALLISACASFGYAQSDEVTQEDLDNLRSYLDIQVGFMQAIDQQLGTKVETLNTMGSIVTSVVDSASADDEESVVAAAEAIVHYSQALSAVQHAATDQGMYLQETNNLFGLVKAREDEGILPSGTLSRTDVEALEIAAINLNDAYTAIEEAKETHDTVAQTAQEQAGMTVPQAGQGAPAGLEVIAWHLPPDTAPVGVPQPGFLFVVNHSPDLTISARLDIDVDSGPGSVNAPQTVTVSPLGARRVDFSVTKHGEGTVYYHVGLGEEVSP